MKRLLVILSVALFAMSASHGAPTTSSGPDFWYALPASDGPGGVPELVRGIVVPSSAAPTFHTSREGSVVSWVRSDGTTQSFVVRGASSLSFEQGPMSGTTFIPFHRAKRLELSSDACCTCASFENSRESVDALSCVVGCLGCGCEGCICSPTYPCPIGPEDGMRLKASNGVGPTMTIGKGGMRPEIGFEQDGAVVARFSGRRLGSRIDARGVTTIDNPDSITLTGPIVSRSSIVRDEAFFAWVSPEASVILEQPATAPAPTVRQGTIDFSPGPAEAAAFGRHRVLQPLSDRCTACGTHPNSVADLDIYDCVPGDSICYRCVGWEC